MALDEALMHRARATGEAVLRVYSWASPTLSLGRHQAAQGRYNLARARALGVDVVRRPTGGRAVLHYREVTYSITAPASGMGSLRESYAMINRLLLDALRRLGVDAYEAAPTGAAPRPGTAPCFEVPVAGELVAAGRKLVGSAQWREHDGLLQHGSILVEDDQWLANSLLVAPASASPAAATLRELLGRAPTPTEVAGVLSAALEASGARPPSPLCLDHTLLSEAAHLARVRYERSSWTWRC